VPSAPDTDSASDETFDQVRARCDGFGDAPAGVDLDAVAPKIEAAFIARVCGCMLGKPFEIDPTMDDLRDALEPHGEWPLRFYPTEKAVRSLRHLQGQWRELVRERITHVAPDDDINYTIIAMLALEAKGRDFTHDDLETLWLYNLPVLATFGPERTRLLRSGLETLGLAGPPFVDTEAELCGALIRADAYGYACPGHPALAAELAFRDASFTHAGTGIYGAMFVAAAIALALAGEAGLFDRALRFVPEDSDFAATVRDCISIVDAAPDFETAYATIHRKYEAFGHCKIHQEIGTLINTIRFAADTADGICKQVMQGNDTDSFGATAGSILGAIHGPIEERWTKPFNDDVHTALASFHERSLRAISERMAALPRLVLS
jgi:ADP-ribosylglycohydrolase